VGFFAVSISTAGPLSSSPMVAVAGGSSGTGTSGTGASVQMGNKVSGPTTVGAPRWKVGRVTASCIV
jgi:hypothetical protein